MLVNPQGLHSRAPPNLSLLHPRIHFITAMFKLKLKLKGMEQKVRFEKI